MSAERETSALPASGLAVVIALVLGIVAVKDQPLETFRPVKAEPSRDQIIDNQDAPARLWQDPFGPVQQHQEELRKPQPRSGPASSVEAMDEHAGRHGIESLRHDIDAAPRAALAIIGVMVSSAAYAEDVERRQRYRYAVLAGLNRAGYVPDNGDHLGYVNVHSAASTQGCGERTSLPELIPFEWFSPAPGELSHERSRAAKVLVLWLSEHAFRTQPVKSIRALRSCLRLDAGSESALVTILAAGGSDQLRAIASKYAEAAPPKPSGRPIRIYAPTATASDNAVGLKDDSPIPYCRREPARFAGGNDPRSKHAGNRGDGDGDDHAGNGNGGDMGDGEAVSRNGKHDVRASGSHDLCLLRTTATDEALAQALVRELALRGVRTGAQCAGKVGCRPDRVALVSEWDTFYGRSLPQEMSAALCGKTPCNNIVRASYMQGLDGVIPGDAGDTRTDRAESGEDWRNRTHSSQRSERAEGRNQFDYLRRLAAELKRQDGLNGEGRITAIGVLGNDVYDKVLVLQALRPQFPEAQFFTTDLDARLLDRKDFLHTRNLVVASSFDLRLRQALQGDIPPFRTTYQTALFFSTLVALSPHLGGKEIDRLLSPRLFEVGRQTAFGLDSDDSRGNSDGCGVSDPLACATIHPVAVPLVPARFGSAGYYLAALLLLGAAAAPLYSAYRLRRDPDALNARNGPAADDPKEMVSGRIPLNIMRGIMRMRQGNTILTAAFSIAALIVLMHAAAVTILASPINSEPLDFLEGISVWPTEALRLLTGLLAIFLTYWAALRMDANSVELSAWFFAKAAVHGVPDFDFNRKSILRGIWEHVTSWKKLGDVFACDLFAGQSQEASNGPAAAAPVNARLFWYQCAYHSSPAVSLIRTLVATSFFYVAGFALMSSLGFPHTPYRGDLSWYVDKFAVLVWSTPLLLFLTFYVADVTLLCKRFISALTDCQLDWPEETRTHFGVGPRAQSAGAASSTQEASSSRSASMHATDDRDEASDAWIDVQLIARRTAAVSPLVYYPTIAMMILLFARSSLFDGWHWPPGLIWVLVASTTVLVVCYVVLRREAESARSTARSIVSRRLVAAKAEADGRRAAQLEQMLRQIENIREGSFAPVTQQPLVKALLIFLSASGLAVLEHFGVISF